MSTKQDWDGRALNYLEDRILEKHPLLLKYGILQPGNAKNIEVALQTIFSKKPHENYYPEFLWISNSNNIVLNSRALTAVVGGTLNYSGMPSCCGMGILTYAPCWNLEGFKVLLSVFELLRDTPGVYSYLYPHTNIVMTDVPFYENIEQEEKKLKASLDNPAERSTAKFAHFLQQHFPDYIQESTSLRRSSGTNGLKLWIWEFSKCYPKIRPFLSASNS